MKEKFLNRLNSLEGNHKEFASDYFKKSIAVNKLLDVVYKKANATSFSFGNYTSNVMYILDFKSTNEPMLELLKDFYSKNSKEFYDCFFTNYNKTSSNDLNSSVVKKQIDIIKPRLVINLGTDFKIEEENCRTLCKEDLDVILTSIQDEAYKNNNKEMFEKAKGNLIEIIKLAFEEGEVI